MEGGPAAAKEENNAYPSVYGGMTVEECQKRIQRALQTPMVKTLMEQLIKSGCAVGDNFIKGVNCGKPVSGWYVRGRGVFVCCNYLTFQDEINQLLKHELIHAYDDCTVKNLNWSDCAHHACSEIRANHLSGDCHFKRELLRGYLKIQGHESDCVKRRAGISVSHNPHCPGSAAKKAVDAVWDTCYNDTKPFDTTP